MIEDEFLRRRKHICLMDNAAFVRRTVFDAELSKKGVIVLNLLYRNRCLFVVNIRLGRIKIRFFEDVFKYKRRNGIELWIINKEENLNVGMTPLLLFE